MDTDIVVKKEYSEDDRGLTSRMKDDVKEIVTKIVTEAIENSINGLYVVLNKSFIAIHDEFRRLDDKIDRVAEEINTPERS